jgi:2-polyprenyl-3-methyl-5-hydroxy-6-metoxy-1,4-benzoquinol methylase
MTDHSRRIVDRERLRFTSNEELKAYYEDKYRAGGYEGAGYRVHGIDISALYHARRIDSALRLLAPAPEHVLLDAGCGNGALAARLAPRCRLVHAIDIAANALDPKFAAISNLRFQEMNLETLAFPDGYFDGIVCVETLEHLLFPDRAIRELTRVLKPAGVCVLTYPTINRTTLKRWGLGRQVPISEHLTEWSYDELRQIVHAAGLRFERVEGIAFDLGPLLALKTLNRFFASSLTHASLAIRCFPGNSMFVALRLRKA